MIAGDRCRRARGGATARAASSVLGAVLVVALAVVLAGCADEDRSSAAPGSTRTSQLPAATDEVTSRSLPDGDDVRVARVVDGDTVVVDDGRTVRLIGVDTPETRHPDVGVQCFGREASAFTAAQLPPGTPVRLVYDVERTDRYGRTLAYVYRADDGAFVNEELVRRGYAQVATVPPNVRHADDFLAAQRAARDESAGLWSACGAPDIPPSTSAGDACAPAYPTTCLPPPPPDLDCADVGAGPIEVRPPDPHRLDGDGDGIGCAS